MFCYDLVYRKLIYCLAIEYTDLMHRGKVARGMGNRQSPALNVSAASAQQTLRSVTTTETREDQA